MGKFSKKWKYFIKDIEKNTVIRFQILYMTNGT